MDPSRTYLSLKLKHMHAIRGAFLTSSPILRRTNMALLEWAVLLWSFHSSLPLPLPQGQRGCRGPSVGQAALNSSSHILRARST